MRNRSIFSLLFCVIISFGCIDPIRLKTKDGAGTLVVDGLITDEAGSYSVKLSRTITFDNSRQLKVYSVPEKGATVMILDNTGFSETLVESQSETEYGVYKTTTIKGVVGNTYSITVKTTDGSTFYSEPETMPAVPKIDSIRHEFIVYDRLFINLNNQPITTKAEGFNIYAFLNDPQGFGNYYRWQADGIFEFFTLAPPGTNTCWVTLPRLESHVEIADDVLNDGQSFSHRVCVIFYDRPTRFMVKMKQASLTARAYAFWKNAENQQTSTGSIFDAPPAPMLSNIKNDDGVSVLGFFGASSVAPLNILFDRYRASGFIAPDPNLPLETGDCRLLWPGATNIRPDGF